MDVSKRDTYVNDYEEWLTVILCLQDQVNGFQCTCPSGYFGDRCQSDRDDCISQPCMNGATCHVSTSILSTSIIRSYNNNNNNNNNNNFYFSDMSVYTPSRHHGLQVTNINSIVMSYVSKTY